jgi:hypothetical protein
MFKPTGLPILTLLLIGCAAPALWGQPKPIPGAAAGRHRVGFALLALPGAPTLIAPSFQNLGGPLTLLADDLRLKIRAINDQRLLLDLPAGLPAAALLKLYAGDRKVFEARLNQGVPYAGPEAILAARWQMDTGLPGWNDLVSAAFQEELRAGSGQAPAGPQEARPAQTPQAAPTPLVLPSQAAAAGTFDPPEPPPARPASEPLPRPGQASHVPSFGSPFEASSAARSQSPPLDFTLDESQRSLTVQGVTKYLAAKEFVLAKLLCAQPGAPVPVATLQAALVKDGSSLGADRLKALIQTLNRKFPAEDPGERTFVYRTLRGRSEAGVSFEPSNGDPAGPRESCLETSQTPAPSLASQTPSPFPSDGPHSAMISPGPALADPAPVLFAHTNYRPLSLATRAVAMEGGRPGPGQASTGATVPANGLSLWAPFGTGAMTFPPGWDPGLGAFSPLTPSPAAAAQGLSADGGGEPASTPAAAASWGMGPQLTALVHFEGEDPQVVHLLGSGFLGEGGDPVVTIEGLPCAATVQNDARITLKRPFLKLGTVRVSLQHAGGQPTRVDLTEQRVLHTVELLQTCSTEQIQAAFGAADALGADQSLQDSAAWS